MFILEKKKCGELFTTENRGIAFYYIEEYLSSPDSKAISLSLLKLHSVMPIIDLRAFITEILFNYLIGNCDAHAKNYSILYDKKGNARLSPIYDVVSTKAFPSLTKKMSMKIGTHYDLEKINKDDFILLAQQLNINRKIIFETLESLNEKMHS